MRSDEKGPATMTATRPDFGPQYNNFYGDEYEKFPTVKEVAASVRKALNAATKDAASPLYEATVSVRYRTYSGGCAIDTRIASPAHVVHRFNDYNMDDDTICTICGIQGIVARSNRYSQYWLTDQGYAMREIAKNLLDAHNHDRSDIQTDYFDVRFYGEVEVENQKVVA